MKKKIINEYKQKEQSMRITENNFRSIYKTETDLEKFNSLLLSPKIKSSKLSLIKYLNETKIQPNVISFLSKKDPVKINKINRICELYFINKGKNNSVNNLLKNKEKNKKEDLNNNFQNILEDVGKKVDYFKEKMKKYNHKINKREKYQELFRNKSNCWNRINSDRLNLNNSIRKNARNYNSLFSKNTNFEIFRKNI